MHVTKPARYLLIAAAMLWLSSCGCSSIRVPAIDPTGASVFTPGGSYTTLESPCASLLPASCLPRPAYAEPSSVPPCQTPVATIPVQPRPTQLVTTANVPDRLLLTPSKIVAPVGSEVVLLAGLAGANGYFVPKQPVEWLLSQESVGHFVDVGEDDHPTLSALLHRTSEKRSSNFAVARTTSQARAITRGTPATTDDIWLQKGQTWVTLTSAGEGVSHVTAVATDAANWEQRRQTATIQWVDAQWLLPAPTVVRAGQSQILTTTINRTSSRSAVQGWLVRYTVASGPAAGFGPDRAQSVDVVTDANGKAVVALQPMGNQPGVTQVNIEIRSPALSGLDGQPVVVGQGMTSVTWSSAGLALRITGPAMGAVGATLDYIIEVTNPGDLPTDNVVVTTAVPPPRLRVVGSQEGVIGSNVRWEIDKLPPRGTQQFKLQCRAMLAGSVRLTATAEGNGVASEPAHVDTEIMQSALRLSMELAGVEDPNAIKVGDRISFNIEVANTSNVPLTNVQLRDSYAVGLQEVNGEPNPISKTVGNLAPGAKQQIAITFRVEQPGELCHTLEATADGGHTASVERCVRAGAPRYDLTVEIRGPNEILTGESARHEIIVTNTGDGELTGVRIVYRADQSLLPREASENYRAEGGALVWTIGSLGPGKTETRKVLCDTVSPNNAAETVVLIDNEQQVTKRAQLTTAIRRAAAAAVAPPGPARPEVSEQPRPEAPLGPTNGSLRVTVADTDDPIRAGDTVSYIVEIENTRQVSDKNVEVVFFLPEGSRFVTLLDGSTNQPVEGRSVSPSGHAVMMPQIREIRPREKLPPYRLQIEGGRVGKMELRVEVRSVLSGDQPVIATADTRVTAN